MKLFPCRNKKCSLFVHHFAAQLALCICRKASPLALAWLMMWGIPRVYSCEHLGLLIQCVWEEEGGSAERSSKPKSLRGIFGVTSLSAKKLVFLLFVFETSGVRLCTCLLHLFSQAKTCLFFPLCVSHIWNRPLSQVTSSLLLFFSTSELWQIILTHLQAWLKIWK